MVIKATNVDGVYDKDPNKHSDAVLYQHLDFDTALKKELKVMDLSAFANVEIMVCLCISLILLSQVR